MPLDADTRKTWERYYAALQYELRLLDAREDFGVFCEMMCPGSDLDDPFDTEYTRLPFHNLLIDTVTRMSQGQVVKVLLSAPPRHGKTFTTTSLHGAWFMGRNPTKDLMVATYSKEFAEKDLSDEFHTIVRSHRFRQVFPEFGLDPENNSAGLRKTHMGGKAFFVGRGSIMTGRGGHLVLIDDPIKNEREARSDSYREGVWEWFTKNIYNRRHEMGASPIMVTQTRWTADDIIGRIADPANLRFSEKFAEGWEKINIPALATSDNDILGRKKGEALWEAKHPAKELVALQDIDAIGFSCLHQGEPVPDHGVLFDAEDFRTYDREEMRDLLPQLRIYCFSDHAVGETKLHDPNCFVPVGVDNDGNVYFLPDIFWEQAASDRAVDQMIDMMRRRKPLEWFPENGHIWRTLEPLLRKRMEEERVYCSINPVWPRARTHKTQVSAKFERVQPALARVKMGKFFFPDFAPWWPRAKAEMMAFPNAGNDDFVDVVALVGLQIDRIHGMGRPDPKQKVEKGTEEWYFGDSDAEATHIGSSWTRRPFH